MNTEREAQVCDALLRLPPAYDHPALIQSSLARIGEMLNCGEDEARIILGHLSTSFLSEELVPQGGPTDTRSGDASVRWRLRPATMPGDPQFPDPSSDPGFHRRSDAKCLVNPAEVVIAEPQAVCAPQVVPLL
jgi:hypothetical protein